MALEQTLIVVKPDGFRRHLTGKILARFEEKGFQRRNLKLYNFTKEKAKEFYSVHKDKPFFVDLLSFIMSGTVVACILEGSNAVNTVRLMVGSTKSFEWLQEPLEGTLASVLPTTLFMLQILLKVFIKESRASFLTDPYTWNLGSQSS